ncbi:MAG TPA: hypothetical protein DIW47_09545 [Bacteroidetes bacterium]|nr:hypothetical protein [Bacteroidota bacterium]
MKPQLLTFLFSFALFILGLNSHAQVQVWNPKYPSPSLRATNTYYLAVRSNELQIHNRSLEKDTFIQFNGNYDLKLYDAYDDVIVVGPPMAEWYWVSEDGGSSWDSIYGNSSIMGEHIYLRNQNEHLGISSSGISRSINGGQSWTTKTYNNMYSHFVNGNHVLLLFNDRIEISNDFGSTFKSLAVPVFSGYGCISETGNILLSMNQSLFGKQMTIFSDDQGTSWDTINNVRLSNIRFISESKVLHFDNKVFLLDLTNKTNCLLNVQDFGGMGFSFESCSTLNDSVFVFGKNIVQFPLDQISCFIPTEANNPKLKLEWADMYVSSTSDPIQGSISIQKIDDRVIFRLSNNQKLFASDGSDTLLIHNILVYDEQGNRLNAYHENLSGNKYFYPTLLPLPPDKGYLHTHSGIDTFILSPDRNHFHVIPWYSKNVKAFSILDKDLQFQNFFRFQTLYNKNLFIQTLLIDEERIVFSVSSNDTFEHVDIYGKAQTYLSGTYRFKYTLQGQLIEVIPWKYNVCNPLPNGDYLLLVGSSIEQLDTVKIADQQHIINNPKKLKYAWLVLDSNDNLKEYYLIETFSSQSPPLGTTHQPGQSPNNIIGFFSTEDFTLYRSDGTSLYFPNLSYQYHFIRVSDDGTFTYLNKGMHTGVQVLNADSNFYLSNGLYRIPFDFTNDGVYVTKSEADFYFGLYDDQANLIQDIGPSGSLTNNSWFYGDYPFVYFIGSIDQLNASIPGNTNHLPVNPSYVIGKFRIDATVGFSEEIDENNSIAYPNPTHSSTTFYSAIALESKVNVLIYGIDGRLVKEFRTETENDKVEIDLSFLPSAWYTVKIESGNSSQSLLILKH